MDGNGTREELCEEQVEGNSEQPVYVQVHDNAQAILQELTGEICSDEPGGTAQPIVHYVHVIPAPVEGEEQDGEVEAEEIQIIQHGHQLTAVGQEHHDIGLLQQAMMLIQQSIGGGGDTVTEAGDDSGSAPITPFTAAVEGTQILDTAGVIITPFGPTAPAETLPEEGNALQLQTKTIGGTEMTETKADPIVVVPLKRGRGRPRKQPVSQAPPPRPRTPPPSPPQPEPVQLSSTGRPKRKAALRFLQSWEALKKKPHLDDLEMSPPPSPERRQPPKPVLQEPSSSGKESNNVRPSGVTAAQPVLVNITVKDKKALQVIDDIGIHMLYYCKHCAFHAKQLMTVTDHILNICRPNRLSENANESRTDPTVTAAILENVALKDIECNKNRGVNHIVDGDAIHIDEHNYAAEVNVALGGSVEEDGEKKTNPEILDIKEDLNASLSFLQPRRWFCPECPYTVFYSQTDLDVHSFCHGQSGRLPLHCYVCREKHDKPEQRKKLEWYSLRVHLNKFHKVHFELACTECEEVSSCHSMFHRHARSHCCQCSRSPCQYVTEKQCDLEVHEKCHTAETPGQFACYLCGYQSAVQPEKWLDLHNHLAAQHPGVINPLYSCNMCSKTFQETKMFLDHKHICNETHYRVCKICKEHVREDHVEFHPGMTEEDLFDRENDIGDFGDGQVSASGVNTQGDDDDEGVTKDILTESLIKNEESQSMEEKSDEKVCSGSEATAQGGVVETAGSSESFHCRQHGKQFTSQENLTKHYMEDHWCVTEEKVRVAQALKKQQSLLKVKRGPGRPRKHPKVEPWDEAGTKKGARHPRLPRLRGAPRTEKCQHCYKKFPSQRHLEFHISRAHTEDKLRRMLCQACGKDFRNRSQWRNHYRTVHEGKKRRQIYYAPRKPAQKKMFICEMCGYSTPESIRLRNHKMSVHEGQMPYECDKCDYKTNEKADMRRHNHKHEGVKRYTCQATSSCAYRTDQRWLLVNHCWRHHGIQMNRITRDTRGSQWSNRRRRSENQTDAAGTAALMPQTITHELLIEPHMVQAVEGQEIAEHYYVPMVTTNENGEEEVAMYAIGSDAVTEQEVAVHTVEEEAKTGEVVYIHEDGTVMDAEEAALMLLAVAPVREETNFVSDVTIAQ